MNDLAIEVRDLIKFYEKRGQPPVRAVQGVSFSVRKGEIFGLLGPNGAGKTTTLKILTTLLLPTSGSVRVMGFDVATQSLDVRKNICVVVQDNAIELYLSVRNNFRTFGRFHGLTTKEIEQRMGRISELFELKEHLNAKGVDLSGGLRRRVQVAKMFLVDKPIVFLDEATTGMDTFNKRSTIAAIKEEARKGRTVVLTTHLLDEAEDLCDSLAIINHGRVIAAGSTDQVKAMGLKMMYVWLDFKKLGKKTAQILKKWKPVKLETKGTSVELTVKDEKAALAIVAAARKTGMLRNFEIMNATLEDVFVELLDKKQEAA
ncbi:MAG: ABC transporter ATP-binding protein [Bacteroidota bacterium]